MSGESGFTGGNVEYHASYDECNSGYEYDEYNAGDQGAFIWCNQIREANAAWGISCGTMKTDKITFKIDTGADTNVISKRCFEDLPRKPEMLASNTVIYGFSGKPITTVGFVHLPIVHRGLSRMLKCEVVDAKIPNVLCLKDSLRLNLIKKKS